MTAGKVDAGTIGQAPHPTANLDQPEPQDVQLHPWNTLSSEPAPQGIEQPIGGGMQQ